MGASVSKTSSWLQSQFSGKTEGEDPVQNNGKPMRFTGTALVYSRKGSMYFDEDGDVAHEFYEEVRASKTFPKATMKRISSNLRPQGNVKYDHPRLNVDFPRIMYQG